MFAADETLIHADVRVGNSTLMLADRKADWPFTPALTQVYVADATETLSRATARGATVVTEVSPFYGGFDIVRFLDPWHNVLWLFAPAEDAEASEQEWDESDWGATVRTRSGLHDHPGNDAGPVGSGDDWSKGKDSWWMHRMRARPEDRS